MTLIFLLLQCYLCWFIVWSVQTFFPPLPTPTPSTTIDKEHQQQKPTRGIVNNSHDEKSRLLLLQQELKETREALREDLEEIINSSLREEKVVCESYEQDDSMGVDNCIVDSNDDDNCYGLNINHVHELVMVEEVLNTILPDDETNCGQDCHHEEGDVNDKLVRVAELIQAITRSNQSIGEVRECYYSIEMIEQLCRNYLKRKEHDQERNRLSMLQSLIKRRFNQQILNKEFEKLSLLMAFLHSKQIQYSVSEHIRMVKLVQSLIRGNLQHCNFRKQVQTTVTLQNSWKSATTRKNFDGMKESCRTIQSFSRGRVKNTRFTKFLHCLISVQCTIRKALVYRHLKSSLSSIETVQVCMLGTDTIKSCVNTISRIKIVQALFIGRLERIKTKELAKSKHQVDCISIMQAFARGFLEKRETESQISSASSIQSFIRAALERQLLEKGLTEKSFISNVAVLQSLVRGRIENIAIEDRKEFATILQSLIRSHHENEYFQGSIKSVEQIQSISRGKCERQLLAILEDNVELLQTCLQAQLNRNTFSTYRCSSHTIGAILEQNLIMRQFREDMQVSTHIQSVSKSFLLRKDKKSSIEKVILLQSLIRTANVKNSSEKARNQLISIQSLQRGYICRKVESLKVESTFCITACMMGYIERRSFLETKSFVNSIQATIRSSKERSKIKHLCFLLENLSALKERAIQEKLYQDTIQKITLLQAIARRYGVISSDFVSVMQSNAKGYLVRKSTNNDIEKLKILSGLLQSARERNAQKTLTTQLTSLQTIIRGKLCRKYNMHQQSALISLQGIIRGYLWRNGSYLYLPNTSLAVAPISVTETIKRIFEDEISEESSGSPTETVPANRRTPSFDGVSGGKSKISQLVKDRITKSPILDLSNMNIESLPTIISDCSHITDLNISKNMLVTLPEWFSDKFPNLKRLNLSGNRFFDTNKLLSENISPISQNLTYLDLSKNRLEYFELHYFDENDNLVTTNFPNLTSLNLSYNQLLNVSSEMFELVTLNKLESLDLSHNQLLTFPTLKSSDLLKKWKDFKFINLEHNSFLQSEIGKIFYLFKKRPDILNQLKGQLYKRGAKKIETKQIDDLEINSEINMLMEEESQTEMTEMAYHDQFKTNLTSLGSARTINTTSDYDSEDDELMTDRSFYSSASNLSSERGISPRFSSPALAQLARKNRSQSATPLPSSFTREYTNNLTEKTEDSPRTDPEKDDTPELDSPKTPRLELLGQTKPIAINILTPISGQAKYSFIQDIPLVQSTTTPTFTPPDYDTKTVLIPKLNFDSSLSPNTPNNFLSNRSASSDNMSTPTSSMASPVVESENLTQLLNNETLKESFKTFCKKEHSVESIEFYDAVATFKKLSNPVEIRDLACNIYDLFINPIGRQALNINKKQIDKVKLELFKEDSTLNEVVSTGTFDSLLYFVKMNLMDPLKRYKATEEFKKLDELIKMTPVDIPLPRPKWGTTRHPLLKVGESKKQFRRKKIPYLYTPKASNNSSSSEDKTPTNPQGSTSPLPERKSINIKQMKNRINNLMEVLHSERKYLSFLIDLWEMYYLPLVDNKYLKGTEQPVSKKRRASTIAEPVSEEPSSIKRKLSFIDKIFNKQKSSPSLKDEEKRMIGRKDALEMFPANLFTIITFNKSFLVSLEERFALYSEEEGSIIPRMYNMMIGDIFEKSIPYFRIYENYLETYESCMNKIRQARAQNKEFDSWIKKRKSHPRSRNLEINSLLVVPVQRVVRYKLLIENLLETTEEDHPDHIHLLKALDMIVDVANQQNNNIRLTNNRVKVRMLTQLFDFYEQLGTSKISSGGVVEDNLLVREGDVEIHLVKDEKSSPKKSNKIQRAYLFTNVIIFVEKTKQVDKQITQEENNPSKSTESSQGETNTNMELRKTSSFIMRKLKKSGSENNLTNSSPTHRTIKVEKKHYRLEDAFVSGGSALTIEIRFTNPSPNSLKSFSTNDLMTVGNFNPVGVTINSARSIKSESNTSEDIPDMARKRSFSLFGKLTGKHNKQTNISKDQTVIVLHFDSTELKNEWLLDLELSIKEAKQRAATKANKLQVSSSLTN